MQGKQIFNRHALITSNRPEPKLRSLCQGKIGWDTLADGRRGVKFPERVLVDARWLLQPISHYVVASSASCPHLGQGHTEKQSSSNLHCQYQNDCMFWCHRPSRLSRFVMALKVSRTGFARDSMVCAGRKAECGRCTAEDHDSQNLERSRTNQRTND